MKIYSKELNEKKFDELVIAASTGKYKEISKEVIKKEIIKQLRNNPALINKLEKKKHFQDLVKSVKTNLHKGIGVFTKAKGLDHLSTKDRDYSIYKKIFELTKKPKKIVDLGSGLNPLSYKQLECNPEYIAYEINQEQVKEINKFFEKNKINGKAYCKDVLEIKKFPIADIYFLLKLVDSLELGRGHKITENLIKDLPTKNLVISFSTKTLAGNPMNFPKRGWMDLMLERLDINFEYIETESELFYIINK